MNLLSESQKKQLQRELVQKLLKPVKLNVFTQEYECAYCKENREIAQEMAALSDKVQVNVFDFLKEKGEAAQLGVDKVPATAILGDRKSHVKFYGVPAGYEFSTYLKDIIQVSRGETELSPETREALKRVTGNVHVKVFVTPTCPYCPGAVSLAHQFAMESPYIKADMIEVSEFPELGVKYNVMGVPKIVINESIELVGLQPEEEFLRQIETAVKPPKLPYG